MYSVKVNLTACHRSGRCSFFSVKEISSVFALFVVLVIIFNQFLSKKHRLLYIYLYIYQRHWILGMEISSQKSIFV